MDLCLYFLYLGRIVQKSLHAFTDLTLLVGRQEEHAACKN